MRLGDFGISRLLSSSLSVAATCVGTPLYLAPEVRQPPLSAPRYIEPGRCSGAVLVVGVLPGNDRPHNSCTPLPLLFFNAPTPKDVSSHPSTPLGLPYQSVLRPHLPPPPPTRLPPPAPTHPSPLTQICEGKPYGASCDVWSLGILLHELLLLRPPFHANSMPALVVMICSKEPPPLPSSYPHPLRQLAVDALNKDPEARPSVAAMLASPSLAGGVVAMRAHAAAIVQAVAAAEQATEDASAKRKGAATRTSELREVSRRKGFFLYMAARLLLAPIGGWAVSASCAAFCVLAPGRHPSPLNPHQHLESPSDRAAALQTGQRLFPACIHPTPFHPANSNPRL